MSDTKYTLFEEYYRPGDDASRVFHEGMEDYVQSATGIFESCCALCESPIEKLFLAALVTRMRVEMDCYFLAFDKVPRKQNLHSAIVVCVPQVKIGKYRVDFLLLDDRGSKQKLTVIECDGHDFHERTKEQAARDRSRDRWFAAQGISVLRFTGSEVYNDPFGVADEVASWLARTA